MARKPEYMDMETTGEIAKHLLKANRRSRTYVYIGIVLVLAIVVVWYMVGSQSFQRKFGGGAFPVPAVKPVEDPKAWVVNPDSSTARVTITLAGPGPLTVDGVFADLPLAKAKPKKPPKNQPPEPPRTVTLELSPGGHLLASELRGAVVQQYLTVKAGEEFNVFFDEATKDVRFDRVPPPKK